VVASSSRTVPYTVSSSVAALRLRPDLVDVFVYVVVLNLANEYVPTVITETFTVSLLTAVLLKVVLEGVVWVKDRVKGRFKAATTTVGKFVAGVALWLVLVVSKFRRPHVGGPLLRRRGRAGRLRPGHPAHPRPDGEPGGGATTAHSAQRESAVNETLTDCA